jgi:hypothetical protein
MLAQRLRCWVGVFARLLGAHGYGIYATGLAAAMLLGVAASLCLPTAVVRLLRRCGSANESRPQSSGSVELTGRESRRGDP